MSKRSTMRVFIFLVASLVGAGSQSAFTPSATGADSASMAVTVEAQQCIQALFESGELPTGCSEQALKAGENEALTARIEEVEEIDPACPPPTVPQGQDGEEGKECVLKSDVTLNRTLQLASFTKLDCQGHRISPFSVGSETVPSSPTTAVLINGAQGVKVEDCVIDGFDFAIVVANEKVPLALRNDPDALERLRNEIAENTITSKFEGVMIIKADNNEISENTIASKETFKNLTGVAVWRDSDLNQIRNNTIRGGPGPRAPGVPIFPGTALQDTLLGDAILLTNGGILFGNFQLPLINFKIGSTLFQFPYSDTDVPEDNLIEGNVINIPTIGPTGQNIAILDQLHRTIVRGNTLQQSGGSGIVEFGGIGNVRLPGTCSGDPSRFCLLDGDCNISGTDTSSKGTCQGVRTRFVNGGPHDTLIENNTLTGPYPFNGLFVRGFNTTVRSNNIRGAAFNGVVVQSNGLETATLTRNVVSRGLSPLLLSHFFAADFGARVFLNDFTGGSVSGVRATLNYAFPSELSVAGRGNFWGRTCADNGGFLPGRDSTSPLITDSHPYGVPVSRIPDENLPATCK